MKGTAEMQIIQIDFVQAKKEHPSYNQLNKVNQRPEPGQGTQAIQKGDSCSGNCILPLSLSPEWCLRSSESQDVREIEQTHFRVTGIGESDLLIRLMGQELSASSCTSKFFLFFSSSFEGFDGSDNLDGLGHFESFDAATVSGQSLPGSFTPSPPTFLPWCIWLECLL